MKFDRHGIRFQFWFFYLIFAVFIVLLLGILQFSLIKPYYRNNQIRTVQYVSNEIQRFIIDDNGNTSNATKATQVAVDNNVCVNIINDYGKVVYEADSLGSGCVFHTPVSLLKDTPVSMQDAVTLREYLISNNNEISINLINDRSKQEMVVYGRTIRSNLGNYYLFVNSPLEPLDSIVDFFSKQYTLYMLIVIVAASLISLVISRSLSDPIIKMQKEADKLSHADYATEFDGGRYTETRELAETLNDASSRLSQIDELRKDLIANVSHDIKTPLTSIKAYAEMIKDISGENPVKREEHLNVIIDEADYLNHLVSDMSELSKIQSGNYILRLSNFDLAMKIREIVRNNTVLINEGHLTVDTELPDLLTVYADETKIAQVIYNFLSNAIKHTPEGKTILIRAYRKEDEETVRVEVIDQGTGIDEQDLPHIWDRYQKSSSSFSRSISSTGLGLAIVKAILDAHHANYGVFSEKNVGSTFWFELKQPDQLEEDENDA